MTKVESRVLNFLKEHFDVVVIIAVTVVAILIRFLMLKFRSGDYNLFLEPWFNEIQEKGLRGVFSSGGVGDYNCPYVILLWFLTKLPISPLLSIKAVSIIFDFGLAIISMLIVNHVLKLRKENNTKVKFLSIITYSIVILLPTVLCNSALWAQCDSVYAFFVLFSVYMFLKRKYTWSFVLLGCAFSFKLQSVFILPAYLIAYFKDKSFSILNFLLIPMVLVVLSLPALVCGLPFFNIFTIYFNQIGEYKSLTLAMLNVYQLFSGEYSYVSLIGYSAVFLMFVGLTYFVVRYVKKVDNEKMISILLLSVLICICFLPSMHERYGYLADILAVLYFVLGYGSVLVPVVIEVLALIGYFSFLFGLSMSDYGILGLLPLGIIIYVGNKFIQGGVAETKKVKLV